MEQTIIKELQERRIYVKEEQRQLNLVLIDAQEWCLTMWDTMLTHEQRQMIVSNQFNWQPINTAIIVEATGCSTMEAYTILGLLASTVK